MCTAVIFFVSGVNKFTGQSTPRPPAHNDGQTAGWAVTLMALSPSSAHNPELPINLSHICLFSSVSPFEKTTNEIVNCDAILGFIKT